MLTRSQLNYRNINEKDFYMFHKNFSINSKKHTKNSKNTSNAPNAFQKKHDNTQNMLLFDIESFDLKIENKQRTRWIPHQISWGIYSYNDDTQKMEMYKKRNYYVSELWVHPTFRHQIETKFKKSYQRHMLEVSKSKYPLKNAHKIISQMLKDIERYDVTTLASYNISSDFKMLNNLVECVCQETNKTISSKVFDRRYSNPFRKESLRYCDLMHNVSILYMDYLIDEGFKDEKIFRNATTKQIKLRGRNNSKSIYSAEYILDKFFGEKQSHTANDDVDLEAKMLGKIIKEKGIKSLEFNVMYPVKLYTQFSQNILEKHSQKIKTAYLYSKSN